jgi:3-deoxy-manno-octulosonate cytidylyltransferase (CMP-KDO synthetase)
MIEHVYRRAAALGMPTVVATDDERIARAVELFGGDVRMTGSRHRTGTDRIAEAIGDIDCDIVVNVQGDLPLLEPAMLLELSRPLAMDPSLTMSTLRAPATAEEYANPNVVKVVTDRRGDALYFSRAALPFLRAPGPVFKHIGLYGFRRDFLITFAGLPQTPLEVAESLEQLRALEHGFRIRTVETQHPTIEVDTPEDLERVRRQLAEPARA